MVYACKVLVNLEEMRTINLLASNPKSTLNSQGIASTIKVERTSKERNQFPGAYYLLYNTKASTRRSRAKLWNLRKH